MSEATKNHELSVDIHDVIHEIKHYLPAQAPLKDFIHHNTLHAFQEYPFFKGLRKASVMFGYNVSLSLREFRGLFQSGKIREDILESCIEKRKGKENVAGWKEKLLHKSYEVRELPRIGLLRANWKRIYHIDLDAFVHPLLFRIICSYLDQGIAIWNFPVTNKGFLSALKELEKNTISSFFKTQRARNLLLYGNIGIENLLHILVGDPTLYKQYLFDQQFAHQGWSGMVATVDDHPETLLDSRKLSLHDLIVFELLLEIDALDAYFGPIWSPMAHLLEYPPTDLFAPVPESEWVEVLVLWQEAFELSYYDDVLAGILAIGKKGAVPLAKGTASFQSIFCIDDRYCSLRRYLETYDPACRTFGTPGFFGVEFYYQPQDGKFFTKVCPAPVTPKYLIKETGSNKKRGKDIHFTKKSHTLYTGWLISQTLGFWAAAKLFFQIFRPTMSPASASSFQHMDQFAGLTIENHHPEHREGQLQVGFSIDEMTIRVNNVLHSIGLVADFSPLVYVVGHGASSVNNPHFAAYDCGACSGRAGSVNARAFSFMANHPEVRNRLKEKGIHIPETTRFVGGLHDTTRDEIEFYDIQSLPQSHQQLHMENLKIFNKSLDSNAKERSRRFVSVDTHRKPEKIHKDIKIRSVSLFEPRPELNHATNALCIIGRREMTRGLFLDRRAFMNSYDYRIDPEGNYLLNIVNAAAPVCGGINLEYYFSRVDNHKLGAGTKLPHNVMGLFGVANGIEGDLRPGLPSQMIEVHDPLRLLMVIEHYPEVVLKTIQKNPATYVWFSREWVKLAVRHPEENQIYFFESEAFIVYQPLRKELPVVENLDQLLENEQDNVPVLLTTEA